MVIAVIDSGINKNYKNIKIIKKICFYYKDNGKIESKTDIEDLNGHGTLICKLLQSINSENLYFIIKILNKDNRSSTELLICALEYLLDYDIDIVLMSLATVDDKNLAKLNQCIKNLHDKNIVMIAAAHNKFQVCYPAILDNVLGVGGLKFYTNDIYYDEKKSIEFIADSSLMYSDFDGKEMRSLSGTSKAAAIVTARLSQIPNFEQMQKVDLIKNLNCYFGSSSFLDFLSEHNLSLKSDENLHINPYIGSDNRNFKVMKIISKYTYDLPISEIRDKPLWHIIDSLNTMNRLLKEVVILYNLNYEDIVYSGNDLYSVDNLCNKLFVMEAALINKH